VGGFFGVGFPKGLNNFFPPQPIFDFALTLKGKIFWEIGHFLVHPQPKNKLMGGKKNFKK